MPKPTSEAIKTTRKLLADSQAEDKKQVGPGRPLTHAMRKVRKLLAANPDETDMELARRTGMHFSSPGKDPVCKAIRAVNAKPSKVQQAVALVDSGAMNQRDAAKEMGVHESAISKHRSRKKAREAKQELKQQKEQQDA